MNTTKAEKTEKIKHKKENKNKKIITKETLEIRKTTIEITINR
jgi:hypothetical protein